MDILFEEAFGCNDAYSSSIAAIQYGDNGLHFLDHHLPSSLVHDMDYEDDVSSETVPVDHDDSTMTSLDDDMDKDMMPPIAKRPSLIQVFDSIEHPHDTCESATCQEMAIESIPSITVENAMVLTAKNMIDEEDEVIPVPVDDLRLPTPLALLRKANRRKRKRRVAGSLSSTSTRTRNGRLKSNRIAAATVPFSKPTPKPRLFHWHASELRESILAATANGERQIKFGGLEFAPPYIMRHTPFLYNRVIMKLNALAEEAIYHYVMTGASIRKDPIFASNFLQSLQDILCQDRGITRDKCPVQDLQQCEFGFFQSSYSSFFPPIPPPTQTNINYDVAQDCHGIKYSVMGSHLPGMYILAGSSMHRGKIVPAIQPQHITLNLTHPDCATIGGSHGWQNVVHEPHNDNLAWWREPVTERQFYCKIVKAECPSSYIAPIRSTGQSRLDECAQQSRRRYLELLQTPSFQLSLDALRQDYYAKIERAFLAIERSPNCRPATFDAIYIDGIRLAVAAWFMDHFGLDILPSPDSFDCLSIRLCDIRLIGSVRVELRVKLEKGDAQSFVRVPTRQRDDIAVHTVLDYLMRYACSFAPRYSFSESTLSLFAGLSPSQLYGYTNGFFSDSFMQLHPLLPNNLDLAIRMRNRNDTLAFLLKNPKKLQLPTFRRRDSWDALELHHPMLDSLNTYWRAVESVIMDCTNATCILHDPSAKPKDKALAKYTRTRSRLTWLINNNRALLCASSNPSSDILLSVADAISDFWSSRIQHTISETHEFGSMVALATFDEQIIQDYASAHDISALLLYESSSSSPSEK